MISADRPEQAIRERAARVMAWATARVAEGHHRYCATQKRDKPGECDCYYRLGEYAGAEAYLALLARVDELTAALERIADGSLIPATIAREALAGRADTEAGGR